MAREIKIVRAQAEQFFDDWLEAMDIDFSVADEDDKGTRERIIKAITHGDLTFSEDGEAVYTPWRPKSKHKDPVTFYERTGDVVLASDGKGKNALARQTFAMMGKLCQVDPKVFSQMAGTDIKVCEGLFSLLMV